LLYVSKGGANLRRDENFTRSVGGNSLASKLPLKLVLISLVFITTLVLLLMLISRGDTSPQTTIVPDRDWVSIPPDTHTRIYNIRVGGRYATLDELYALQPSLVNAFAIKYPNCAVITSDVLVETSQIAITYKVLSGSPPPFEEL